MSKTYTLTATVTCKSGVARSTTLANATTDYTTDKRIGSTGASYHYSCILAFDAAQMAHLRGLASSAITSSTLEVSATTAASGAFHPFYGAKKATGTSSAEISSSNQVAVAKNATKITIDVKSLGIPSTNAFCIGSQANVSGETYATMRGITATLTVVTTESDFKLSYNANGGSGAPGEQTAVDVGSHTFTISSTEPTRSGYIFKGWAKTSTATSAAYQPGGTISISSNTTLYAVWYKTLKLSYNANGGSNAPAQQSSTVYSSATFTISSSKPTPASDLWAFDKWNTKADGSGTPYASGGSITITANTTLYAQYVRAKYQVSIAHGNYASGSTVVYKKTKGTPLALVQSQLFSRSGYTITGWSTNADGSTNDYPFGSSYSTEADITLYPYWTALATDDIHIKHNASIYGGEVWKKKNGQMYRGEVWHKTGGQMYKGG